MMQEQAIDKIRDEMAGAEDEYVQVVGEYLTGHILEHPQDAAAILSEGKTIAGSMEKMREYARRHKSGSVGVVTPERGFAIVLEYFGIAKKEDNKAKNANVCVFEIGLDDLLD